MQKSIDDAQKDLQIAELKKDIAFLQIKFNAEKKKVHECGVELQRCRSQKNQKFQNKAKDRVDRIVNNHKHLTKKYNELLDKYKNKKKAMVLVSDEKTFLIKRIKQVCGLEVYAEICNHIDNPRKENYLTDKKSIKAIEDKWSPKKMHREFLLDKYKKTLIEWNAICVEVIKTGDIDPLKPLVFPRED